MQAYRRHAQLTSDASTTMATTRSLSQGPPLAAARWPVGLTAVARECFDNIVGGSSCRWLLSRAVNDYWDDVCDAEFVVPAGALIGELALCLRDPDPHVRDGAPYVVLRTWIARDVIVGERRMRRIRRPRRYRCDRLHRGHQPVDLPVVPAGEGGR